MIWKLFLIWMALQVPLGIVVGHFLHGVDDDQEFDDLARQPGRQIGRRPMLRGKEQ